MKPRRFTEEQILDDIGAAEREARLERRREAREHIDDH